MWLVPSGKMRMLPPDPRKAATFSNTASFAAALLFGSSRLRTTGTAFAVSRSQRRPGIFHSVLFAMGDTSHGARVMTRMGSMSALTWFETKILDRVDSEGRSPTSSMLWK